MARLQNQKHNCKRESGREYEKIKIKEGYRNKLTRSPEL